MGKSNPLNPHSRDEGETKRDVPMPFSKGVVESVDGSVDSGFHTATVRIYNEGGTQIMPVLPISIGSAWVPKPGTNVVVIFGSGDKPYVVGPWYSIEQMEDRNALPEYEPGEMVIGNGSGGSIRIDNDGNIFLNSSDDGDVYIDGTKQ